jgi:hypothetical protein
MVPGNPQVKVQGSLRVGGPGFNALEACASPVFEYLKVKFYR